MARVHWIEFHEQPWCPESLRDAMTDYLQFAERVGNIYHSTADLIRLGLEGSGATRVLDLCSGGSGPWLRLYEQFPDVEIRLTDLYPNAAAFQHAAEQTNGRIGYIAEPVDATDVPAELTGFRTMFTGFHHFRPADARRVLEDSVQKGQGIGIFEITERKPGAIAAMCLTPLMVLALVPFIRPFKVSRLLWTYLVPLMPILTPVDGIVSCLRTYSVPELEDLVRSLDTFEWHVGARKEGNAPARLTYLVGYPKVAQKPIDSENAL